MDTEAWRSALQRDVDRFAMAVDGRLDRSVPTCPEWKVRDLTHHLTRVLEFWTAMATGAISDPKDWEHGIPPRPDDELVPRLRAAGAAADAVYDLDPATPCWSWSPHRHVGFVQRRLAQETAVHTFDAVAATGGPEPIERELAVDGVTELIDTFLATEPEVVAAAPPIELEAVDTGDRWRMGRDDGLPEVSIEATASDLLLLLWKRPTAVTPVIDGDEATWDRFQAAIDLT